MSAESVAPITEKQRVSLPVTLWASLVGIIITGAGAWATSAARADNTAAETRANSGEIREHDKLLQAHEIRLSRSEEREKWRDEMLEKINDKLDRLQRDRRDGR